ncbi:hypothetical protein [Geomicrobium sp. JCM 19038]|uniref:hypothetical protein n=1 Tax=Geomicrobium sp. JCM 19038 TaxID=1460635 RepID=UPI00045F412A|nr:hypothetical protein [Geomicrobium sp. JCM 19038]GAK08078.1 hypothetical protein JCM19038_1844 [Geomicrobium sp. JCM 19038]
MDNFKDINLTLPTGCDNAPRKKVIIDLTLAFLANDSLTIQEYLHPTAVWMKFATNEELTGIEEIKQNVEATHQPIRDLTIASVITHGKFASVDGVVHFSNNHILYFCDVFTFTSASNKGVVKEINSYHIRK